jgi:hypothetical protein
MANMAINEEGIVNRLPLPLLIGPVGKGLNSRCDWLMGPGPTPNPLSDGTLEWFRMC